MNSLSVVKFVSTAVNHRNILSVVFYQCIFFFICNCRLKFDLLVGHEMNVHFHRQPPAWDHRHPPDLASLGMLRGRSPLCTAVIHQASVTPVASLCVPTPDYSKVSAHLEWALVQIKKPWSCPLSGSQKILLETPMAAVSHLLSHSPTTFAACGGSPS